MAIAGEMCSTVEAETTNVFPTGAGAMSSQAFMEMNTASSPWTPARRQGQRGPCRDGYVSDRGDLIVRAWRRSVHICD
jgi:hypothetical protein